METSNKFAVLQDLGDDEPVLKDPGVRQVDYLALGFSAKAASQKAWYAKFKADKSERVKQIKEKLRFHTLSDTSPAVSDLIRSSVA